MKKIILLNFILLFLYSCENALEVDLPEIEPKLVIHSILFSDNQSSAPPMVTVSNSIGYLSEREEYIYTQDNVPVIDYATVSITDINSGTTYPLLFDNVPETPSYYINHDLHPTPTKEYRLEVSAPDLPSIYAIDKLPDPPNYTISNFKLLSHIDDAFESHLLKYDLCELSITINDNPNEKNYYRLSVIAQNEVPSAIEHGGENDNTKPCKYKVQDPIFLIPINKVRPSDNDYQGKHGFFTDELFNGQEKTFFIEVDKPEGSWSHMYVEIATYSENLYQFVLTQKKQRQDVNNILFNSEPINLASNIEGGYGIFGAAGISRKTPIYDTANVILNVNLDAEWVDF